MRVVNTVGLEEEVKGRIGRRLAEERRGKVCLEGARIEEKCEGVKRKGMGR